MSVLPKPGERIVIRWPGGPHDYDVEFLYEDTGWPKPPEPWRWLRCHVIRPEGEGTRMFHVRPAGSGVWELVPRRV